MKKRLKKKKTKQICMLIYLFQKNDTNFNVIIHAFPRADNNCDTPLCGYRWFFKSRNIIKNIKYENYESISFTNYEIKNGFEIYCQFKYKNYYYTSKAFFMASDLQDVIKINNLHLQRSINGVNIYCNQ